MANARVWKCSFAGYEEKWRGEGRTRGEGGVREKAGGKAASGDEGAVGLRAGGLGW